MDLTKTFVPVAVAFAMGVSLTASCGENHIELKRYSDPFVVRVNPSLSSANAYTESGSRVPRIPFEGEADLNYHRIGCLTVYAVGMLGSD